MLASSNNDSIWNAKENLQMWSKSCSSHLKMVVRQELEKQDVLVGTASSSVGARGGASHRGDATLTGPHHISPNTLSLSLRLSWGAISLGNQLHPVEDFQWKSILRQAISLYLRQRAATICAKNNAKRGQFSPVPGSLERFNWISSFNKFHSRRRDLFESFNHFCSKIQFNSLLIKNLNSKHCSLINDR